MYVRNVHRCGECVCVILERFLFDHNSCYNYKPKDYNSLCVVQIIVDLCCAIGASVHVAWCLDSSLDGSGAVAQGLDWFTPWISRTFATSVCTRTNARRTLRMPNIAITQHREYNMHQ
jgi:hypothetical protein